MKQGLIIAIDGPSAAGKSTVGKLLARELNYTYIDTGAMYRALAFKARQLNILEEDELSLKNLLCESHIGLKNVVREGGLEIEVFWDREDVTSFLRTPQIGMSASKVSALPGVRLTMVDLQRKIGKKGSIVMDGRDIGSFVFPNADKKFFLDASQEERAKRRFEELQAKGLEVDYGRILDDLKKRDLNDQLRNLAPLIRVADAIFIDSTGMEIKDVVLFMIRAIHG